MDETLRLEWRSPAELAANPVATTAESWRPMGGYEDAYEVSDLGRVRRIGRCRGTRHGRCKRLAVHPRGYLTVTVQALNKSRSFLVHRLVAAAFVGPIPSNCEVNHKDGDKRNNDASNLEIVTRQQNIDHAVRIGLIQNKGERNTSAKLTQESVREIRSLYTSGGYRNGGLGYKAIAKRFGISWETVRDIVKRRSWTHVTA